MRVVIQRVSRAKVVIGGEVVGEIGIGFVVLLGIEGEDTAEDGEWLAAGANVALSVVLSLVGVWLGWALGSTLNR